jgi:hypothetical protein
MEVLRRLHWNGARAPRRLSGHGIVDHGLQLVPVDPTVIAELPVLGHHHRPHEIGRDVFKLDPTTVIALQRDEIGQHQRRDRSNDIDAIEQDQEVGSRKQEKSRDQHGPDDPRPLPPPLRRYNLLVLLQCLDFQCQ